MGYLHCHHCGYESVPELTLSEKIESDGHVSCMVCNCTFTTPYSDNDILLEMATKIEELENKITLLEEDSLL